MSLTILLVAWALTSPPPELAGEIGPTAAGLPESAPPAEREGGAPGEVREVPEGAVGAPAEGTPEGAPTGTSAETTATETTATETTATETTATPAPLPSEGPPPPEANEPRAWGGAVHAPLPRPPASVEPSMLTAAPWRGRFWLGVGLAASIPLGGRPPAAGGVVSVAGELGVGWRVNRYLGLLTAVSSFAHDAGRRSVTVDDGTTVTDVELGRITAFDVLTARVFAPVHRRIEPWAELGAGVGARRGPFAVERQAVGLVRAGAGVDFWLAPALTLGASTAYRATILGDAVGHGLRVGADLGLHW